MQLFEQLDKIRKRYQQLESLLSEQTLDPSSYVQHSKEYAKLHQLIEQMKITEGLEAEISDLEGMVADSSIPAEMSDLAQEELPQIKAQLAKEQTTLHLMLLPSDDDDQKNVILEVRAGTGGQEAALFASDLLKMYRRYAEFKGWRVDVLHTSESDYGGMKEASISIQGQSVFAHLKFEAGVHRVQRVPETEASGRIHTSAATVSVLPEAEEVDIHIEDKDLRIEVFRSSGPGGQSVNTTDSAVRIIHIPTGITVQQQDEKSQHKNKAKALKILRARLYDAKREAEEKERNASKKSQIGRGDRSERIRTYNFPQSRITDHRIKLTLHKLAEVLEGQQALEELIEALISTFNAERLASAYEDTAEPSSV
jgi:peptide chain release factor 1